MMCKSKKIWDAFGGWFVHVVQVGADVLWGWGLWLIFASH